MDAVVVGAAACGCEGELEEAMVVGGEVLVVGELVQKDAVVVG